MRLAVGLVVEGDSARLVGKAKPVLDPVGHILPLLVCQRLVRQQAHTRAIQHYLGHKNIQHTVVYTQLASSRFNDFSRD
jgi:site-specific recombinase XerD